MAGERGVREGPAGRLTLWSKETRRPAGWALFGRDGRCRGALRTLRLTGVALLFLAVRSWEGEPDGEDLGRLRPGGRGLRGG